MKRFKAIDLCCGAGGWAVASRGLPIDFVAVADIAADCLETWRINHAAHYPDCAIVTADLSTRDGMEILLGFGPVDLILGGIPCNVISCARGAMLVKPDEMDRWRALLDNCLAIVGRLDPRWWCFEDVIGIERELPLPLWHGAEIPFRRINARDFGPQSRLRTFLGVFPEPQPNGRGSLGDCLLPGPHLTIPGADALEPNPCNSSRVYKGYIRLLDPSLPCPTITSSFNLRGGRQRRTWIVEDERGRRRMLSWQEAALVQGFPRDYLFASGFLRAAEMIGQAIPIQVGRAILEAICREARLA